MPLFFPAYGTAQPSWHHQQPSGTFSVPGRHLQHGPFRPAQPAGCTLLELVLQSSGFGDFQTGKVAVTQAAPARMAAHEQSLCIPLTDCSCSSPGEWKHTHCSISSTLLSLSGSTKPIWSGRCSKLQKTVLEHFHRWSIHNHHPAPDPQWSSQDLTYL